MSWFTKVTGLDKAKNKRTRDAINKFLSVLLTPKAETLKAQYLAAMAKKGVNPSDAETAWSVLLIVLDAPAI